MPEDYHQYNSHQKHDFWKTHVEQWQQGGLSQSAYCRRHGLKANSFYYWRRRILSPPGEVSLSTRCPTGAFFVQPQKNQCSYPCAQWVHR